MSGRQKRGAEQANPETIRITDVITFLKLYQEVDGASAPVPERANLSALLKYREAELGPPTTVLERLKRILRYVFDDPSEDVEQIFKKEAGVLTATPVAHTMFKHMKTFKDVYDRLKADIIAEQEKALPVVHIGAPQTIGLRLLSAIFSDWKSRFGSDVQLEIEIANSSDLIPRLNAGLLDFVVAYGRDSDHPAFEPGTAVKFRSLGYRTRMVLLCHPKAVLRTTAGADANAGYWESKAYRAGERPAFENLRVLKLDAIDFTQTKLIVVPSWDQPKEIRTTAERLPRSKKIEVPWYDEALALARMGAGVAITAEVFSKRQRITAFRLEANDHSHFERSVGVYYHAKFGLTGEACRIVTFIREYLDRFPAEMRAGCPPAIGNPKFHAFCESFDAQRDWVGIARNDFGGTE